MKYLTTIGVLIFLNIFCVISLIYFGSQSGLIEDQNKKLKIKIFNLKEQIVINKVELNVHQNYDYLKKLENIYFDQNQNIKYKIVRLNDLVKKEITLQKVKSR